MAFLVAGTLHAAALLADTHDSLGRKGEYSVQGPRMALVLSSPGVSAATITALEDVFQALGFESCQRREALVQNFLQQLTSFRKHLDALGGPVSCALVALVAPRGQLRQPQKLIWELSCCEVLQGCPKVFLLLSSGPEATPESGPFLASLRELCGRCPHWSLLQLLTELFCRVTDECGGNVCCPVLRSSLRGALCLGSEESWRLEAEPVPSAQYDMSGARAALLLAVTHGRPGAEHDVEALGGLCRTLGFQTTLRIDPTVQAFWEELARFQEQLDSHQGPVSCVLVALMAHGGPRGQLLGADEQEIQPEALVQELCCCPALRSCPKIILVQACRGGNRDAGRGSRALPWYRRWLWTPPTLPSHADVLQVHVDAQGGCLRGPTSGSCSQADMLMVYAASEGCVAYRDEKGSDFIQTLVDVLRADPRRDLLELLTEVNRRVCELDVLGPDSEELRKACLEIRSSLRGRLCLRV